MKSIFKGSYTALITPMCDGHVDEGAFIHLINWQIDQGTHGLVAAGTTGESPTLSYTERIRVFELCVETAGGRIPVIAGAGSNDTAETISLAENAKKAGASALLLVAPYYNKPNQEGLYRHFRAVSEAVDLPQFIYNIPGRSIVDISVETMSRLFELPNIIGLKDATGNLARVSFQRHVLGQDFIQFSGDDLTALGFNAQGGHGCISVTSNIAPRLCTQFQEACLRGDWASALDLHDRLTPLHHALFLEPNPAPVKYAASLLNICKDELRLPLVPVSSSTAASIREAMVYAGLLDG